MRSKSFNSFTRTTVSVVALLCSFGLSAAHAAEAVESDESDDVIVVTAQKKEQSIKDVPISITAFSGQLVRDNGWTNPVDMLQQLPNVNGYSTFGAAYPQFYMRGIGNSDPGHGAISPVGVYVNEVYLSSLAGQGFSLYDLERVEVLRGPQGTLWGKNTTGGAMNFITKKPGNDTDGYVKAGFGLYNDDTPVYDFEAAATVPLVADTLAARFAFKGQVRDPWITNEIGAGPGPSSFGKIDGVKEFSGRVTVDWKPADNLDMVLRGSMGRRDGNHAVLQYEAGNNPASFVRNGGYVENPAINVVSQDHPTPEKIEYENLTLTSTLDGEWGSLTSISAYVRSFYSQDADVDATPRDGLFGPFQSQSKQFSQELRLASPSSSPIGYVLGAYYFHEKQEGFNWYLTGSDLGPGSLYTGCCENSGLGYTEARKRESYALFGAVDLELTQGLKLNGGLRYTHDKEDWSFQQLFWTFTNSRMLEALPKANSGAVIYASAPLTKSWSRLTGDVALTYKLTDDVNVYAKYARGYLSGNHILPTSGTRYGLVDPETINDYEGGIKAVLADGKLSLDGAFFYYDYKNVQVNRLVVLSTSSGFVSVRENAASATVKGVELDAKYAPNSNLTLSGGFGWTDAKFDKYVTGGLDRSGFAFPQVPKFNWNVAGSYKVPLASGAKIEFATDWNYQDGFYVDTNFTPVSRSEKRTIGNAYIRYHHAGDAWSFSLYARNVLNNTYVVSRRDGLDGLEGNVVIYGAPRVIGASLDMKF